MRNLAPFTSSHRSARVSFHPAFFHHLRKFMVRPSFLEALPVSIHTPCDAIDSIRSLCDRNVLDGCKSHGCSFVGFVSSGWSWVRLGPCRQPRGPSNPNTHRFNRKETPLAEEAPARLVYCAREMMQGAVERFKRNLKLDEATSDDEGVAPGAQGMRTIFMFGNGRG